MLENKKVCEIATPRKNVVDDDLRIRSLDPQNPSILITNVLTYNSEEKTWILKIDGFLPVVITYTKNKEGFNIWDGRKNYKCPNFTQ